MRAGVAFSVVTAALLAVPGSASGSGVNPVSQRVVGATAVVSSCGSLGGLTVSWTVVDGVVSSITLGSIPAGCTGGSLSLTLANASNTSLGGVGSAPITGASQTLTPTGSPDATAVSVAYVSVVGP